MSDTPEKPLPERVASHIREAGKLLEMLAQGVLCEGVVVGFEQRGQQHFVTVEIVGNGGCCGPGMGQALALISNPIARHRNPLYG